MKKFCMLNGALVHEEEAMLHSSDLSIRRGFGIFDFFRVRTGKPMYMQRHIDRIIRGAELAGMGGAISAGELIAQVTELIGAHIEHPEEGGVRIVMTGGYSPWDPASPNLILSYEPLKPFGQSLYTEGAAAISYEYLRELPQIKTVSYMTAIYLTSRIREAGAMEVLYHHNGLVHEFSRSNVFIIRDGALLTPSANILAGITRGLVLEIAGQHMPVRETDISLEDVLNADEVFMTSTIKRIIPVVRLDAHIIGTGTPGPLTQSLMKHLAARDSQEIQIDVID